MREARVRHARTLREVRFSGDGIVPAGADVEILGPGDPGTGDLLVAWGDYRIYMDRDALEIQPPKLQVIEGGRQ